jgi:hypothetical protein
MWPKSHVPVAHACSASYSGGKDQEHPNLRPAQAKGKFLSPQYPTQKKAGGVA